MDPVTYPITGSPSVHPAAAISHWQATPLRLAVESGQPLTGATRLVAELHDSRITAATPLAAVEHFLDSAAGPWVLEFSAAQLNAGIPEGLSVRNLWLVIAATWESERIEILATRLISLHRSNFSGVVPPAPAPALYLTTSQAAVTYATLTALAAVDSRLTALEEAAPGTPVDADTLEGMPASAFSPATHTHAIGAVDGLQSALNGKAPAIHTHVIGAVESLQSTLDGKAPAIHTHVVGAVDGLQSALEGKAPATHTHVIGAVDGLQSALDGKAPATHTHVIGAVDGLQSALDGKAPATHTHAISAVDGLQSALDGKAADPGTVEANSVQAGPSSGGADNPVFRLLLAEDLGVSLPVLGSTLVSNGPGSQPSWVSDAGGGILTIDVQSFDVSGTWTKPAGAVRVDVWAVGGGGGGGSGRKGTTNGGAKVRTAGGGGSHGCVSFHSFRAADLGAAVAVTAGAGGAGGAARTSNGSDGAVGAAGGTSSFGTHLIAFGGNAGINGWYDLMTQSAPYYSMWPVCPGAGFQSGGLAGTVATGFGGTGGGGASFNNADVAQLAANGGNSRGASGALAGGARGTNGTTTSHGSAGTSAPAGLAAIGAGGGGGNAITVSGATADMPAGNGGSGGIPGGGGGGGGAGSDVIGGAYTSHSGAGGTGGSGRVIVTTLCYN